MRRKVFFLPVAMLALAAPLFAQLGGDVSQYEARYGNPVDVSLSDLVQNGTSYEQQAVRTRGRLEYGTGGLNDYALRDAFGDQLRVLPVPELGSMFSTEAHRFFGQDVTLTGVVLPDTSSGGSPGAARVLVRFWSFVGPEEKARPEDLKKAGDATLEQLVAHPGSREGQLIRVVGKFRGRNLYGDLPSRSQRGSGDWVIKDEEYAIWVTGKKAKGEGFDLDPGLKRDTGQWLSVIGRPETIGGITYLHAQQVTPVSAPPNASVAAAPPPPPRPRVPPSIVFVLPLEAEPAPMTGTFTLQFSKDMDEKSFPGHVQLRYTLLRPGEHGLDAVKVSYDPGRRLLIVDPGDALRPGRVVELRLLPGITDTDGIGLVPRTGQAAPDAVEVVRWTVGG